MSCLNSEFEATGSNIDNSQAGTSVQLIKLQSDDLNL